MALVEIIRFDDVYEADLAAAFLASHGIEVTVTERFQTTVDPLMQRALGIRLLGQDFVANDARSLLARAAAGEFANNDGDDTEPRDAATQVGGTALGLMMGATGAFWGTTLPRRFRLPPWQGFVAAALAVAAIAVVVLMVSKLILDPP